MTKFIWLIGGSQMSIPMAQRIKERGYSLILTDRNPDCACRKYADHFGQVDVYDETATLTFARSRLPGKTVAVLTTGTDAGVEVAVAAQYLGLPAVSPEAAWRVRSKAAFRRRLGLKSPRFEVVRLGQNFTWDTYPCVVKPDNASGSKGLSIVEKPEELPPAILKAIKANRNSAWAVIEEKLQGEDTLPEFAGFETSEVAMDFLVEGGKVHFANAALRLFWRDRPGIEAGHFNPFEPAPDILAMAQQAATALRVDWGPFKFDIMRDARYGWVPMEAATRLSGGYDSSYTSPLATGRDVYGAYLDMALGQRLDLSKLENKKGRIACCLAPRFKPGQIENWLETGLIGGTVFYQAFNEIRPLESNADRPVFIIAEGENHQEAFLAAQEAAGRIEPIYV
jgi:biotin carboxylase